jgi:hypothetical protein
MSETSTTKSESADAVKTFATLRLAGDGLAPDQVTKILKTVPTQAYAKGDRYSGGARSPNLVGRTGVWYFSTVGVVASDRLDDHLAFLIRLLIPAPDDLAPLLQLQQLVARLSLEAHATCFWHGHPKARRPSVPRNVTDIFKLIPATIETDFGTDEEAAGRRVA